VDYFAAFLGEFVSSLPEVERFGVECVADYEIQVPATSITNRAPHTILIVLVAPTESAVEPLDVYNSAGMSEIEAAARKGNNAIAFDNFRLQESSLRIWKHRQRREQRGHHCGDRNIQSWAITAMEDSQHFIAKEQEVFEFL
jgi:hypothetical protein